MYFYEYQRGNESKYVIAYSSRFGSAPPRPCLNGKKMCGHSLTHIVKFEGAQRGKPTLKSSISLVLNTSLYIVNFLKLQNCINILYKYNIVCVSLSNENERRIVSLLVYSG